MTVQPNSIEINFTNSTNKEPIIIEDKSVESSTSLSFPGRNTNGYGQVINENFLHLMENFANTTPPKNPVEGQLWYDSNIGVSQLKIYDGTQWSSSGGLKKGTSQPSAEGSIIGDLWVNTGSQQLYLFTGSGWILVGPEYSSGSFTGVRPQEIIDTANNTQTVVVQYVLNEPIAIISKTSFIPKSVILGFDIVNAGITLNSNYNKYYGIAEKAESLIINSVSVPASNFLRNDKVNNTSQQFNIRNAEGVAVGEDAQLKLMIDNTAGVILYKTAGANLDIRVNSGGNIKTVIRVDSSERVGINNTSPQESLHVTGNILSSGNIRTEDTTNSISTTSGSAVFAGGAGFAKDVNIGGKLTVTDGIIALGGLEITGTIAPQLTNRYDLGSQQKKFYSVHSSSFYGDLFVGAFSGNATTASKLSSPTVFKFSGDVSILENIEFDGALGGTTKTFDTRISENFIADKPAITVINDNDEFLINRSPDGLKKISKLDLWSAISGTPVGAVLPYAGVNAPSGWLLCDGSEVKVSDFPKLFDVIGYIYGDINVLQGLGTFRLPDMRGRMALGIDNMNNGIAVPSKNDPTIQIQTNTGSANRVTSVEADNIGLGSGSEKITLDISNLPDHEHDMQGSTGSQYYAGRNVSGAPTDTSAISGTGSSLPEAGQYLPSSGGISTLNNPITILTASGTGSIVTLTFSKQTIVPFPVGTEIRVLGTDPAGYSGTYTVISAGDTFVTYANTTTGPLTVSGTIRRATDISLGQSINVMNPYLALNYIIYTGN